MARSVQYSNDSLIAIMFKIANIFDRMISFLLGVILASLVGICFCQVVARYVFNSAFTWAEEVSIVLLLWAAWLGACLALKDEAHLKVTILETRLGPWKRMVIRLFSECIAILFLGTIAYTSSPILDAMKDMVLGSLPAVPMNVMYWSVPIGSILMIFYIFRSLLKDWQALRLIGRG